MRLGALAARVARRSRARESAASIAPAGGFSMFRADRGDLLAGLIIAAVGGWFLVGAFDYRLGMAVRMGPGYLPMVFGIITLVLGLGIMLLALGRDGKLQLPAPGACLADRTRTR